MSSNRARGLRPKHSRRAMACRHARMWPCQRAAAGISCDKMCGADIALRATTTLGRLRHRQGHAHNDLSRRRLRMVPVGPETTAHDRRADPLLADEVVVVAGVIDLGDLPVNDADDRLAIGAAARDLEATADKRNAELHAADVFVLDLVREELGPQIEALRPIWNAGAGLQRLGVHADNRATPINGDIMGSTAPGTASRPRFRRRTRRWCGRWKTSLNSRCSGWPFASIPTDRRRARAAVGRPPDTPSD